MEKSGSYARPVLSTRLSSLRTRPASQPLVEPYQIPFELPGGGDGDESAAAAAAKALGQVPMAHTCDNILELPNYWLLLMRAEGVDEKTKLSSLSAAEVHTTVCPNRFGGFASQREKKGAVCDRPSFTWLAALRPPEEALTK